MTASQQYIIICIDDESSPENGQQNNQETKDDTTSTTTPEETDSPKPMCVDTGDDEEVESENKGNFISLLLGKCISVDDFLVSARFHRIVL